MNRLQTVWCPAPDDDEDVDAHELVFRVREDWLAVDGRELVMPITLLERDGEDVDVPALLKQFGGESMLNDMLLSDYDVEKGSKWLLRREPERTMIDGIPDVDE